MPAADEGSLDARIEYGFCRMYKPVLDDAPWRVFDTMAEYRAWCAAHLPAYLGFQAAAKCPARGFNPNKPA